MRSAAPGVFLLAALFLVSAAARAERAWTVLTNFPPAEFPQSPLVEGGDGQYYGTLNSGGDSGYGAIYKITSAGLNTPIYSFTNGVDGANPIGGLINGRDGNLYGVASYGGTNGSGVIFRLTTSGAFTPLYSFTGGNDGAVPNAGLTQLASGAFYGTTYFGGSNDYGGIFVYNLSGSLTELYSFTNGTDGLNVTTVLAQGADNALYGIGQYGGDNGAGLFFRITTNGQFSVPYTFPSGAGNSSGILVPSGNGFYITSPQAGANGNGALLYLTLSGSATTLYSFTGGLDGSWPGPMIMGGDGTLYGTALYAGQYSGGTVFNFNPDTQTLTTELALSPSGAGNNPGALVQGSDLNIYGVTIFGAANGGGALFKMSPTINQPGMASQLPDAEYSALTDLYDVTEGAFWNQNFGWNDPSSDLWFGVTVAPLQYDANWNLLYPSHVVALDLPYNNLVGPVPDAIGNLTALTDLELFNNNLSGGLPSTIGNLTALQTLWVSSNPSLGGAIPSGLGNLTQLRTLYIDHNDLTGTIPDSITNLTQLETCQLSGNLLEGTIPPGIGALTNLNYLDFSVNILSGTVPPGIGNLTELQNLYLGVNALTGSIPSELGLDTNLMILSLTQNVFDNTIPDSLTNLVQLHTLDLSWNSLSGPLPQGLGALQSLNQFYLDENNTLNGSIPASLGECTNLQYFDCSVNSFTGCIPDALTNLTGLQNLYFSQNQFTGSIPCGIGGLTNLQGLSFAVNLLSNCIPSSISNLTQLVFLDFDNNSLSGTIPDVFEGMTNLQSAYFYQNDFSNNVPSTLGLCAHLQQLDLSGNQLDGGIPDVLTNLTQLQFLSFDGNTNLGGSLPQGLANWVGLQTFEVNNTSLSGRVPDSIGAMPSLQTLDLGNNNLSGPIPDAITNLGTLQWANFGIDSFTGTIPAGIGSLTNATSFYVNNNNLTGGIPSGLAGMTNLQNLGLHWNQLSGPIPDIFAPLPGLGWLDLEHNAFTGSIPPSILALPQLGGFYVDANQLSGPFPSAVGGMSNLTSLSLAANNFSGSLPLSFTNLTKLTWLDLDADGLTGTIPTAYAGMTQLQTLVLFSNELSGTLPRVPFNWLDVTWNDYDFDTNSANLQTAQAMIDNGQTVLYLPQQIPTIVAGPQSQSVTSGEAAQFSVVVANGQSVQWFFNGRALSDSPLVTGSQSNLLTITDAQSADAGSYQAVAYNSEGSASSAAVALTVIPSAPYFVTQPAPAEQFVVVRSRVVLSALAEGSEPLAYQWQRNGVNLSDNGRVIGSQSNVLTISLALASDTGVYQLLASNAIGYAASTPVNLAVATNTFTNFAVVTNLQLNGSAAATNDSTNGYYIRLTSAPYQAGSFYLAQAIPLTNSTSFSSVFSFRLIQGGADGITFNVQSDSPTALGAEGGGLGYAGIGNSVGVSFDTYQDQGDPSGNYAGIVLDGNASAQAWGFPASNLNSGAIWYAWVDYNGGTSDLEVRASETNSRPATALVTYNLNILDYLHSGQAWFGFTGSTGTEYDLQEILAWQLVIGVTNTNGPTVSLIGNGTTNVECHTPFVDPGATASEPGIGSLPVTVISDVNTNSPGVYNVLYEAVDTNGNTSTAIRTVNVVDTTPPVVTLIGPSVTNIECHSYYSDPGAAAYDTCAGALTAFSQGTVDPDTPGIYTVTYMATDHSGNVGMSSRTVIVSDTLPPAVTLNGPNPFYVLTNTPFADPGASAVDICAGNLPVTVRGSVNPALLGTYFLGYVATDPSGNSATNTRTVVVVTNIPPYFTQQPSNQIVPYNGAATFAAGVGGSAVLNYQWRFNGVNLTDGADVSGSTSPTLTILNATAAADGTYTLVVTNTSATVTSAPVSLLVYGNTNGPNLIQNGGFETGSFADWTFGGNTSGTEVAATYVHSGTYSANLNAPNAAFGYLSQQVPTAANTPYLVSFWFMTFSDLAPVEFQVSWNGAILYDTTDVPEVGWTNFQFIVPATGSSGTLQFAFYSLEPMYLDDVAVWSVGLGSGPEIVQNPTNEPVAAGAAASFNVVASSSSSLNYQWQFEGTNLPGATSSAFSISSAQFSNAGPYDVIVSNPYGAVTSAVADLTLPAWPISFNAHSVVFATNRFSMQLTGLAGQGPVVIGVSTNLKQWSPLFTNPSGFGTFQFTDSNLLNAPQRFYRAVIP